MCAWGSHWQKNIHINKTPCLHLKFCFCHSIVDLAKYVSKLDSGYNVQQFGTEESGTKIRSVEGVLAILKRVNNVWPLEVAGQREEEGWLAHPPEQCKAVLDRSTTLESR